LKPLLKRWLRSPNRFRRAREPEPVVADIEEAPQAVIEHEELPLPEEVKAEEVLPKSGRRKRKPLKLLRRWKKKRSSSQS
jgi:hypothetical protein